MSIINSTLLFKAADTIDPERQGAGEFMCHAVGFAFSGEWLWPMEIDYAFRRLLEEHGVSTYGGLSCWNSVGRERRLDQGQYALESQNIRFMFLEFLAYSLET